MATEEAFPNEEAATPAKERKTGSKWVSYVIETAIIIVAIVLVYILRREVYETAIITSGSMQPTLFKDDRAVVDHRRSLQGQWRRGDIVLVNAPESWGENDQMLVKRIIGMPGENLEIRNGQVWVNGKQLVENYTNAALDAEMFGPFHLGATEYFVMGDNRPNSEDSRIHGPIDGKYLHGRFTLVVAPFDHIGRVRPPSY
jgi:signal peptidase I